MKFGRVGTIQNWFYFIIEFLLKNKLHGNSFYYNTCILIIYFSDIINGFDIDVKCNFKQICTPKVYEKSYKVFFDSTPEQGKHVVGGIVIFKLR